MEYLAIVGGTSSNVNTQKLVLNMKKDLRYAKHKVEHLAPATFSIKTYKHYIVHTTIIQIIYQILMKQEFKLVNSME